MARSLQKSRQPADLRYRRTSESKVKEKQEKECLYFNFEIKIYFRKSQKRFHFRNFCRFHFLTRTVKVSKMRRSNCSAWQKVSHLGTDALIFVRCVQCTLRRWAEKSADRQIHPGANTVARGDLGGARQPATTCSFESATFSATKCWHLKEAVQKMRRQNLLF